MRIQKKANKIEKPLLTSWSIYSEFLPRLSRVMSRPRVCLHLFSPCVLLLTSYSLTLLINSRLLPNHRNALSTNHSTYQCFLFFSSSPHRFIPTSVHSRHCHQSSQTLHLRHIHFSSLSTSQAIDLRTVQHRWYC